jgi:hypothetical protein
MKEIGLVFVGAATGWIGVWVTWLLTNESHRREALNRAATQLMAAISRLMQLDAEYTGLVDELDDLKAADGEHDLEYFDYRTTVRREVIDRLVASAPEMAYDLLQATDEIASLMVGEKADELVAAAFPDGGFDIHKFTQDESHRDATYAAVRAIASHARDLANTGVRHRRRLRKAGSTETAGGAGPKSDPATRTR